MILRMRTRKKRILKMDPNDIGVLIAAVANYGRSDWNLNGPINDAYLMGAKLQSNAKIPQGNFICLFDHDGTKEKIEEALKFLVYKYRFLVFYWSGHGTRLVDPKTGKKHELIVTYGIDFQNPMFDYDIAKILAPCEHAIVIFDCCHAQGGTRSNKIRVRSVIPPEGISFATPKNFIKSKKITEIASCQTEELSLERPYMMPDGTIKWHGDFTYQFSNQLDNNTYPYFNSLQHDLRQNVTNQTPTVSYVDNIPLFYYVA